jgi:hypothetical protein
VYNECPLGLPKNGNPGTKRWSLVVAAALVHTIGVEGIAMARVLALLYGVICYLLFLAVFVYAIGFVGNVAVPKSIDSGAKTSTITALLIDAVL